MNLQLGRQLHRQGVQRRLGRAVGQQLEVGELPGRVAVLGQRGQPAGQVHDPAALLRGVGPSRRAYQPSMARSRWKGLGGGDRRTSYKRLATTTWPSSTPTW